MNYLIRKLSIYEKSPMLLIFTPILIFMSLVLLTLSISNTESNTLFLFAIIFSAYAVLGLLHLLCPEYIKHKPIY